MTEVELMQLKDLFTTEAYMKLTGPYAGKAPNQRGPKQAKKSFKEQAGIQSPNNHTEGRYRRQA